MAHQKLPQISMSTFKQVVADVSYIDSTGIGVLVGIAHRAQEIQAVFVVAHPQKNVARVFDLLGVTEDLNVREND